MSIVAKEPENTGIRTPEGTHQAVCYAVWDVGNQKSSWNGVDVPRHKIVIAWEIDETIDAPESEYNGKRYVVSKWYTLSLHEKSMLYKDLCTWRGKRFTPEELQGFDVEKVIGAPALVTVEHNDKYTNVTAVVKPPKGMPVMEPENSRTPPKWVEERQANQFSVNDYDPTTQDAPPPDRMPPPAPEDDLPF